MDMSADADITIGGITSRSLSLSYFFEITRCEWIFFQKFLNQRNIPESFLIDIIIDKTPGVWIWLFFACVNTPERKENYIIMADKIIENNQVSMMGRIATGFTFSHQVFGEGFYTMELLVKRLSDSEDRIPVMVSERLIDVTQDYVGEYIEIHGQFRSYNRHEEKHNRLVLSVFARELRFVEDDDEPLLVNQIFLDGFICKPPVYRKTPLGREIADVLLAVNRPYSKSDYIPCICWGRNARYASAFAVGGHVLIWGRIQSREYVKKTGDNTVERRTAYEVSVSKLEYVE